MLCAHSRNSNARRCWHCAVAVSYRQSYVTRWELYQEKRRVQGIVCTEYDTGGGNTVKRFFSYASSNTDTSFAGSMSRMLYCIVRQYDCGKRRSITRRARESVRYTVMYDVRYEHKWNSLKINGVALDRRRSLVRFCVTSTISCNKKR